MLIKTDLGEAGADFLQHWEDMFFDTCICLFIQIKRKNQDHYEVATVVRFQKKRSRIQSARRGKLGTQIMCNIAEEVTV